MRHEIVLAKIGDGNVQSIRRARVSTIRGIKRVAHGDVIWMTRETALAFGVQSESFYGYLPDDAEMPTQIQIKTNECMRNA